MFKTSFMILGLAVAGVASAAPLNLTGLDGSHGQNAHAALDGNSQYFFSGPQVGSYDGGASTSMFCVDFDKHNSIPTSYDVASLTQTSISNGALVGKIFNKFGFGNSATQGAAIQLAIWDAVYDNGDGLGAGRFQGSDLVGDVASILGADFTGVSSSITYYSPTSHGTNGDLYQGMITGAPVPEPASMAVLAVGAVSLLRRRRKA